MSETTSGGWDPERDLAMLLDALTEELLTAPDRQVTLLISETGDHPDVVAREMRRLVAAAEADLGASLRSKFSSPGLRAYIARNQ